MQDASAGVSIAGLSAYRQAARHVSFTPYHLPCMQLGPVCTLASMLLPGYEDLCVNDWLHGMQKGFARVCTAGLDLSIAARRVSSTPYHLACSIFGPEWRAST